MRRTENYDRAVRHLDVDDDPTILQLAEEVRRAGKPRMLRRAGQDIVVVLPLSVPAASSKRSGKTKPAADYEAFQSAAGSWADVDTDRLIEEIYATRRRSNPPPLEQ